jgi:galactokinase
LVLEKLAGDAKEAFNGVFGYAPRHVAAAPGRVNLIGEHTDYTGGYVLPMAIDRYVVIAAGSGSPTRNSGSPRWTVHSTAQDATVSFAVDDSPNIPGWCKYLQGVLAGCLSRGLDPGNFDALVATNLPLGGGLSSSAALEVATATIVEAFADQQLEPKEKARLCQQAEHEFVGVPCGIMDQFTSVFGREDGLLLLDCRTLECEIVPLDAASLSLLIVNTGVQHELANNEYTQRRTECEQASKLLQVRSLRDATLAGLKAAREALGPVLYRRAHHVVSENERTLAAAAALRRGEPERVGPLMYASHASLRDDYEVSCKELDLLEVHARSIGEAGGVLGSRMTGGGFGGSTVSLVRNDDAAAVAETLRERYQHDTGIEPAIFAARAAAGACLLNTH